MKHHEISHALARMAVAGALTCGVAAFAVSAAPAYAAGTTLYVGASAGSDTSCASPGYTTVQSAVNAASPGDTVYLCGTAPYKQQVIITKSITLTGDSGATIAAPSTYASAAAFPPQFASDNLLVPQALVVAWGHGVHVTISGLTISGPLPGNGGCAEEEYGILVIDGASAQVTHDTVTNIKDTNSSLYGCQFGVGIDFGAETWPTVGFATQPTVDFTGTGTISHTTISGYQKNGVVVDGPGSHAQVSDNDVTGAGPSGALGVIIAQNGIQVSDGASGQVTDNTVSANQYSGGGFASADGILVFGGCGFGSLTKNVTVFGNTLINNDIGVQLSNSTGVSDPNCSIAVHSRTNDVAMRNRISDSVITNTSGESTTPLCGYQAGVADLGDGDAIAFNHISGTGYKNHPKCTTAQPYVTLGVDTTGSIDPTVYFNL